MAIKWRPSAKLKGKLDMAIKWRPSAKLMDKKRKGKHKKCKQCGVNHYKHSSFCSDKCTKEFIASKK